VSTFIELLRRGEFVVTAELDPSKSAAASVVRRRAGLRKGFVDAVQLSAIEWPDGVTKVVEGAVLHPRPKMKESKSA
jgi:hypothetical protein